VPETCPTCGAAGGDTPGWCDACATARRTPVRVLLDWLADAAQPLAVPPLDADPLGWPGYADQRHDVRDRTGLEEAVVAVEADLRGTTVRAVVVAWDFDFLGGSMSSGVGAVVAGAFDHARDRRLPIVLLPSTGGARMQEGMASLVQMAATSVAAQQHGDAGLLRVAVLRDPTTGGVFASHANLCDIVLAEPGATIGFAGPRVAEALTGGPLPEGSHTARGARAAGLVDAVVARPDLPATLARLLSWSSPATAVERTPPPQGRRTPPGDAWTEVQRARAAARPRTAAYLTALDVAGELHGDRAGSDDPTIRVVLARWGGAPVVVVGMDRSADEARVTPGGYRKAWRGFELADRIGVPVVTLIDTPGAAASAASEAGGIAHHIARTFTELLRVRVPVVALVIGEGGSGGALALAVGDRLLIQEHAVFSVIAPEGAAAILYRDAERAPEVAALLKPTSRELLDLDIADEVVPEPEGLTVAAARAAVSRHLRELEQLDPDARREQRLTRWRNAGQRRG
jgi:acetyl-CoA carboxylase carboxyl transferase alpha subunit/acetyl-CoA carboxylase carboxyl transferase beta subunit